MDFLKSENKIYLEDENGKIIAEIDFEKLEDNKYNIYHTFVDDSLRGRGIASKLVEAAVKEIKSRNGIVEATCSYAKSWLKMNK